MKWWYRINVLRYIFLRNNRDIKNKFVNILDYCILNFRYRPQFNRSHLQCLNTIDLYYTQCASQVQYSHADIGQHILHISINRSPSFVLCKYGFPSLEGWLRLQVVCTLYCMQWLLLHSQTHTYTHTCTHSHLKRASTQTILNDCIRRWRVERILWTDSRLGRIFRRERAIFDRHPCEHARICCVASARTYTHFSSMCHTFCLFHSGWPDADSADDRRRLW